MQPIKYENPPEEDPILQQMILERKKEEEERRTLRASLLNITEIGRCGYSQCSRKYDPFFFFYVNYCCLDYVKY